jgi:hypothetical protein
MRNLSLLVAAAVLFHSIVLPGVRAQVPPAAPRAPAARTAADAIRDGLQWLVAHQDEDGSWSASQFVRHDPKGDLCTGTGKPDQDFHVTAWATMALLGAGNTQRLGAHRAAVVKALTWIEEQMRNDGFLGVPEATNAVSSHAMTCLALSEGDGLSERRLRPEPLRQLLQLRLPDGTWPARPGLTTGDADATYWASCACLSGTEFGAIKVDLEPTLQTVAQGGPDTALLPGAETLLRLLAHHSPTGDSRIAARMNEVLAHLPQWPESVTPKAGATRKGAAVPDFVAWYLGTYASYQVGGGAWNAWHPALEDALLPHQRTDGAHAGSWDPVDVRGRDGGRLYATAANLLSLEACQRFARAPK